MQMQIHFTYASRMYAQYSNLLKSIYAQDEFIIDQKIRKVVMTRTKPHQVTSLSQRWKR